MNNQPIGILDSGVGGLSIWREIVHELPNESTIYIADSANCPYGNKSSKEIYRLSKRLVEFLISKDCKLIVLACNTITVSSLDRLRQDFPNVPIIGTVPVIKTAAEKTRNGIIGILSTMRTAHSDYQKDLIEKFANSIKVINIGTNVLVPYVEQGNVKGSALDIILQKELKPFRIAHIDTLALGCSHFSFIKGSLQKILGDEVFILDSTAAIARQVGRVLENNNALSSQKLAQYAFYTTGDESTFTHVAKNLLAKKTRCMIQSEEVILPYG